MTVKYSPEEVRRYMQDYHNLLSLRLATHEEARKLLNSAKEIPDELRDDKLKIKMAQLERTLTCSSYRYRTIPQDAR